MADREATAVWEGAVPGGKGVMKFADYTGQFSYSSRFEEGVGTNPEELLGGALAGCFAMAVSSGLTKAGYAPKLVKVTAKVALRRIEGKARIPSIHLVLVADVPDVSAEDFQRIAAERKADCPVSFALAGVEITLEATLNPAN